MARGDAFDVVGFDADDTLWKSEDYFQAAEDMYAELVGPHTPDGVDALDALHAIELDNVPISGYGVKAFALSMVQAAVTATGGRVPASVLGRIVDHAHEMLMDPVELLDGVPETLAAVGRTHRLVLITKGDLVHQIRKVRTSGLEHHFEHIEVVLESLSLFVRYQLTVTAPLPDADSAARAVGRERFEAFVSQVGRQLASGARTLGPGEGASS